MEETCIELDQRKYFLEPDILPEKVLMQCLLFLDLARSQTLKQDYLGVFDDPAPINLWNRLLTMFMASLKNANVA